MKLLLWVYVSFWGDEWSIFGRMSDARDEVLEAADVVCSVKIVVLCAIHALVESVQ